MNCKIRLVILFTVFLHFDKGFCGFVTPDEIKITGFTCKYNQGTAWPNDGYSKGGCGSYEKTRDAVIKNGVYLLDFKTGDPKDPSRYQISASHKDWIVQWPVVVDKVDPVELQITENGQSLPTKYVQADFYKYLYELHYSVPNPNSSHSCSVDIQVDYTCEWNWERIPTRKVTTELGFVFTKSDDFPAMGLAYKDPSGLIWKNETKMRTQPGAAAFCKELGARLPTRSEFTRFASYLLYEDFGNGHVLEVDKSSRHLFEFLGQDYFWTSDSTAPGSFEAFSVFYNEFLSLPPSQTEVPPKNGNIYPDELRAVCVQRK